MQEQWFFRSWGGRATIFGWVMKIFILGRAVAPTRKVCVCVGGGDLTSSLYHVATEIYHGMCHLWIIVVPISIIVGIRIDVTNHSNRFEEQLYLTRKI